MLALRGDPFLMKFLESFINLLTFFQLMGFEVPIYSGAKIIKGNNLRRLES